MEKTALGRMTYVLKALKQACDQFIQWPAKEASVAGEEKTEERIIANKVVEVTGPCPLLN